MATGIITATKALLGSGWSKRRHDFRVGAIPNTQNTVMTTGDDDLPIWRDRGGVHEIGPTFKGADFLAVVTDRSNQIVAGGSQCLVGDTDETDGGHLLPKTFNGFLPLTGHKVPHLDHIIGAGTGQRPSVPFPTDAEHVMRMAFKRLHDFAVGHLPDFDVTTTSRFAAARRQSFTIRTESDGVDPVADGRCGIAGADGS